MENLPEDIQSEILSYVPRESVLECKLVSKTWNTLLSHRKTASGLLLNMGESSWSVDVELWFGYCDEIFSLTRINDGDRKCLYEKLTEIEVKHPLDKASALSNLIGSCNGLVCLFMQDIETELSIVHFLNPFTGECFDLPIIDEHPIMVMGFGYDPCSSNYKLVKIQSLDYDKNKGLVQIYTLGCDSNGWRSIGEVNYSLINDSIFWNGSIYWLDKKHWKIVAFDLADEKFRCLGLPTAPSFEHTKLTLLGGYLGISSMDRGNKCIYIWLFKKKQKDGLAVEDGYYPSREWILEFTIPFFDDGNQLFERYEPFGLATNNEVFLWYDTLSIHKLICRYDPKTDSLIKVLDIDFVRLRGIPHVNSLVSLKALGVDSTAT